MFVYTGKFKDFTHGSRYIKCKAHLLSNIPITKQSIIFKGYSIEEHHEYDLDGSIDIMSQKDE